MRATDGRAGAAIAALALLAACGSTQRVPGPIWLEDDAPREVAGGGGLPAPGAAATVIRHTGPVTVARPGAPRGHELAWFDKRARLAPGGTVGVGYEGRAELLWPASQASVVLLGRGEALLGEPGAEGPLVRLAHVSRAQVALDAGDRVGLPGGGELRGEQGVASGPFLVEQLPGRVVRVRNQSKQEGRVAFRGKDLQLLPGDAIDLPILGPGVLPPPPPGRVRQESGGVVVEATGRMETTLDGERVTLQALELLTVLVGGVRVRLDRGESLVFRTDAPGSTAPASAPFEAGRPRD